jgi:hypothetical protein
VPWLGQREREWWAVVAFVSAAAQDLSGDQHWTPLTRVVVGAVSLIFLVGCVVYRKRREVASRRRAFGEPLPRWVKVGDWVATLTAIVAGLFLLTAILNASIISGGGGG